jgi:hypothetical protein
MNSNFIILIFVLRPQRITIPDIIEDKWFQKDYVPACGYECNEKIHMDDVKAAFDSTEVKAQCTSKVESFIN